MWIGLIIKSRLNAFFSLLNGIANSSIRIYWESCSALYSASVFISFLYCITFTSLSFESHRQMSLFIYAPAPLRELPRPHKSASFWNKNPTKYFQPQMNRFFSCFFTGPHKSHAKSWFVSFFISQSFRFLMFTHFRCALPMWNGVFDASTQLWARIFHYYLYHAYKALRV